MLASYLTATRRLLQLPAAPATLYTDTDLTIYINTARGQLAGEGECVRAIGTVPTVVGQQAYDFVSLSFTSIAIQGPINVRRINYTIGTGQKWIESRPWEWFDFYVLNNPAPAVNPDTGITGGVPTIWTQYAQGAAPSAGVGNNAGGSFYINIPDAVYVLNCDCTCYPIPLVDDTTLEAIPYLWTDAVPYYAAYMALLSSQAQARVADAMRYFEEYKKFVQRARTAANPSQLRYMYEQATDVPQASKLGIKQGAQ